MGQYFSSCLSLTKNYGRVNAWASVVQVIDANKNVIYARGSDGKYIGRNRTALTDKGIIATRFYQNGTMALENAWISYFSDFADDVKQDVMIPTLFATGKMSQRLEEMTKEGTVTKEYRTMLIAPACFNEFYGDGLDVTKEDGILTTCFACYKPVESSAC